MVAKDLSNEQLAAVIRAIKSTGISPTEDEKKYLEEAAIRIEKLDRVENWMNETINKLENHFKNMKGG